MRRFIFILAFISLLLDYYLFQGVKTLTRDWKSARAKKGLHWGFWILILLFNLGFCWAIYRRFTDDVNTALIRFFINGFMVFFFTKLIFNLVLFAEDIFRLAAGLYRSIAGKTRETKESGKFLPQRRKFMSQLALGIAAFPFAAFVYGVWKGKYRYTVHRQILYFEDLPAAFDGFTITQISDFHAGSFDEREEVQRGMELARAQKSDLVVFTGDLVNNFEYEAKPFLGMFRQLKAPFGQYSILGNHDYGMYHQWPSKAAEKANLQALMDHHAEMDYRLLLDENVTLEKDSEKIVLLGVENWGRGFIQLGDLDKALQDVAPEAFKILLSHDPSHWQEIVKEHPTLVQLTLSGHTHGMQFGVETPLFKWSPAQYRYKNWAGLAEEKGRKLYVNRGFGYIGFSGRVGIWPEITVLELRRGKA